MALVLFNQMLNIVKTFKLCQTLFSYSLYKTKARMLEDWKLIVEKWIGKNNCLPFQIVACRWQWKTGAVLEGCY